VLRIDEAFLERRSTSLVDQVLDFLIVHGIGAIEHFAEFFADGAFGEEVAFLESAEDGFFQGFERALRIEFVDAVVLRFEAGLQEEIAEDA
jgi:hypothetical protein